MLLTKNFYNRDTLKIAQDLLGCYLVRKIDGKTYASKIIESEAYIGYDDKASHASRGRTKRNEAMFMEGGTIYVYLVYGMYNMLNIVTERIDFPAAVLIRALKPSKSDEFKKNSLAGPGKLSKELKIDRNFNTLPIYLKKTGLWIEEGEKIPKNNIIKTKRIGIDYAEEYRDKLWRFLYEEKNNCK